MQMLSPYMKLAFEEAKAATVRGEVPIGAVITDPYGELLARAGNRTVELKDPTAHAEILAMRAACSVIGSERLSGCDLYVTLEPCAMCATAISFARIARVYYAAEDEKMGGVDHGVRIFAQASCHHRPEIYSGMGADQSKQLLKGFFAQRR